MSDLYQLAEKCAYQNSNHVFSYGAHASTVEEPFECLIEGCGAVLMPVISAGEKKCPDGWKQEYANELREAISGE